MKGRLDKELFLTVEDRIVVFEVFPLLVPFWVFVEHHIHSFPEENRT